MDRKKSLIENTRILQRKLKGLGDSIFRRPISAGQERFLMTYLEMIDEFVEKGLDIIDEDKYREVLAELED